jgi:hypothetical protein
MTLEVSFKVWVIFWRTYMWHFSSTAISSENGHILNKCENFNKMENIAQKMF